MAALPTYIPLPEAARRLGMDASQLRRLAESGKIEAAQLPDGDLMINENDTKKVTSDLPRFISLPEAVQQYELDGDLLLKLIEKGEIKAATAPDGEVLVDEAQIKTLAAKPKKEDLPEYQRHAHLSRNPIWISEAEKKYNVSNQTLSRWARKGHITIMGRDKNRVLLDEQDVAYCADIYHKHGGQGKTLFNLDGTPYAN